ncbi:dihydroorotate dehydrogenase (quinone), partial [Candidatus Woesearchaeota archaeon CG10_big_fil_rev_8_21_14_0_10_34_8]
DYETINISCPNAFGGEDFTDPNSLHKLLLQIDKTKNSKPVFLKISPDLKNKEIDEIIKVADKHKIAGFICTNLTKSRDNKKILDENVPEKGGISGKVVEDLANEMISYVYKKTQGKYIIIGCGGISSAEDAYKKIKSGASLVQLITGAIFEGPQLMSEINQGLVRLIEEDGYNNISDAIGVDVK